jgi:division protein CdvB (Snf7/Vps24/ESCRT-III family)
MNMGDNQTKNKIIIVEFKKIASFVMNILHEIILKKLLIKVIKQKKRLKKIISKLIYHKTKNEKGNRKFPILKYI